MTGATLGSAIATVLAGSDGEPLLERDVFGTIDPQRITTLVDRFCGRRLDSGVAAYEFFVSSVGERPRRAPARSAPHRREGL
jgi:hypothetical protein